MMIRNSKHSVRHLLISTLHSSHTLSLEVLLPNLLEMVSASIGRKFVSASLNTPTAILSAATALHPAWRDSLLVIEPLVSWKNSDPPAVIQGTFSYLTNVTTQISKVAGHAAPGASYVNEANPNEPEGQWREVFWSTGHYDRLLKIKSKYDKKHLFNCYRCIGWNDSAKKKFPKIEIEI